MPAIDDVQFDTNGWEPRAEPAENRCAWTNGFGDILSLRFKPGAPTMPSLFRFQALREHHARRLAASGGTILSLDLLQVKGLSISKLVVKTWQPAGGWGYLGILSLPYRDFSFSIRMQTLERAGDEAREHHAWNWLHDSQPAETDCLPLWFGREEAPHNIHAALPNLADNERWDADFPEHPLSRLRTEFSRLIPTLSISRDVKNSAPHRG